MKDPLKQLLDLDVKAYLCTYSALEKYFRKKSISDKYIVTNANIAELAMIFEDIEYPGYPLSDAMITRDNSRYIFKCIESTSKTPKEPFTVMELLYDPLKGIFLDPNGIYSNLREEKLIPDSIVSPNWVNLFEAAKLISKFHYTISDDIKFKIEATNIPPARCQRELLIGILSGRNPDKGLSLLLESGFIEAFWPEIYMMTKTLHSKDFHPEGNVWEHTLEALKLRKTRKLELSLGLFLHDIGKAYSTAYNDKPFFNHSIIGAKVAKKFLRRLGFPDNIVERVSFLVKNHMFPHAMRNMPPYRRERLMESDLFPLLLEVYMADTSSSYKGLDSYYEACRIYKKFLKEKRNPFKSLKSSTL